MNPQEPLVGVAVDALYGFGRQLMRGIMRYANARHRWRLVQELQIAAVNPDCFPSCRGAIVTSTVPRILARFHRRCRFLVSCSGGADPALVPTVSINDHAVGRLAAEHLLDCRLRYFAYYGNPVSLVSCNRLAGFQQALKRRGFSCRASPVHYRFRPRGHLLPQSRWGPMLAWLHQLPKPVGILAMDDLAAQDLAAACLQARLAVPQQIAILGVNNDDLICECAWPPLSSVHCDFQRVGYAAARLLDRLMAGQVLTPEERELRLNPVRVVRRASTDLLAVDDPVLAAALRYIRERACHPCRVPDVLEHVAVSRRWLERQFAQKLGRTPHDEIVHVRMEIARRSLLESNLAITEVAEHCGFSTVESFNRMFKRIVGESPAAYRRSHTLADRPPIRQ